MKSILLSLFLFLALGIAAQSEWTVDYPEIDENLSQDFQEIYRVVKTDTALLIQGNVYHRPNYWVQLDTGWLQGCVTGKRYRLVRSYDFPLSKRVGMPAAGTREFTLQFELPAPEDKRVDYYDEDGTVLFKGIHLYPEKPKGFRCLIRGTVEDSMVCSRLVLCPYNADIRVQPFISIPVRNGKFEYPFYANEKSVYTLLDWHDYIGGGWRPKDFWVEPGTVEFGCVLTDDASTGIMLVPHTPLNKEKIRFEKWQEEKFKDTLLFQQYDRLEKENRLYSPKMQAWLEAMEKETINRDSLLKVREQLELAGEMYTPEMEAWKRKYAKRNEERKAFGLEYAQKPSLNGLYIIAEQLQTVVEQDSKLEPAGIVKLYQDKYRKKYAGHPLAEQVERFIGAMDIKVGGRFIDFVAPDLEGNPVKLSEYIRGKVALIDLWASWCGGCRKTSKSMIPVYQDYKDKGFTILGIARENGDTGEMKKALKKDGFPWLNLVELNDRGGIWYKYGVGNAGGMTLLVDRQGVILAVSPDAEQVRQILQNLLDH